MPAAIPLIAGAFLAAGSVATAVGLGTLVVAGLAISWAAVLTVTGVALLAVAYLARKTPKPESAGQQLQQKLDPQAPVPIAYGRTASGGYITWRGTWGKKNAFYGIVTVLSAGGPIQGIESYRAGDYPIGFSGSPAAQLATCNNVGGFSGSSKLYKGKLRQRWVPGNAPASDTPASLTGYPIPAGAMSGLAHSITSFEYNADAFPQNIPASLWTLNGVKLYDPRKDSTYPGGSGAQRVDQPATWTFSENPYLAALQWTLGRYENGKRVYGIGAKWSEVDVASFVNGANVADANGWKIGGVVTTSDDKYAVLASLLTSGSGVPVARGAQIACSVNAPKTAVLTLTREDIIGEVEISSTTSWRDRQNTIIPRYREESQNWEIISGERLSAATYVAEDGGETKTVEIEFPLVQQAKQAHQLAAYELVNSREFLTFTVNAKMRLLAARVGDAIMVNVPQVAANAIKCTVAGREFNPADLSVTLTLKSETDAKHAYALGQTQVAPPSPKLDGYDPSNPEAPASTAWAITATAIKNDTVTLPAIVVTGATDDPNAATIIFEYRPLGSSEWLNGGEYPRTTNRVELTSVTTGTAYEVAVSYRTNLNVIGERLVLGATAGDMKVDWQTIVDGAGKPDDDATKGAIVGGNIKDINGNNLGRDDLLNSEGSFNAVKTYDFNDNTAQGVNAGGANLTVANGVLKVEPVNTDPMINVPVGKLGRDVPIIRVVARPLNADHAWQGQVYYETASQGGTAGRGASEGFTKKIAQPELVTGKQIVLEWDMRSLTAGGTDYLDSTIVNIRIDLEQSTSVWEIDAIQLGSRTGASLGAPEGTLVAGKPAETVAGAVTTLANAGYLDTTAPGVPASLTLNSVITDAGATLNAAWTARTESDFAGYVVAIRETASGNLINYNTTSPFYQWTGFKRNTVYQVQVQAFDKAGNYSGFSSLVSHTTARDTVAPALPTSLSFSATYNQAFLSWTNPADADLDDIEIWRSTTNNSATATKIDTTNAVASAPGRYSATGLAQATTYYFWLKAVDTSNNASAFTSSITATTAGGIAAGDFTPGLAPIREVATLPAVSGYTGPSVVWNSTDKKLYRFTGTAWTVETAASDLTGTLPSSLTVQNIVGANTIADAFTRAAFGTVSGVPANLQSLVGTEALKNADITVNSSGQLVGIGTTGKVVDNTQIAITNGTLTGIGTGSGTTVSNASITVTNGLLAGIGTGNNTAVGNGLINVTNGVLNGIGTGTGTSVANTLITITSGVLGGIGTGSGTAVGNTLINVDATGKLTGTGASNVVVDNTQVKVGGVNLVKKAEWVNAGSFTSTAMPNGKSGWGFTAVKGTSNIVIQSAYKPYPSGQDITLSVIAWNSTGTSNMLVDLFPDTLPETLFVLTTTPTKFTWTTSSSHADMANAATRLFFVDATSNNKTLFITDIQWELGNKATDWKPNPNDPDALRQAGFSGDLDSTKGAPTGTSVGGTLAENIASAVTAVTSDNIASPSEKPGFYNDYQAVVQEETYLGSRLGDYINAGKGDRYGAATKKAAVNNARAALAGYFNNIGLFNDFNVATNFDGSAVRTMFANYRAAAEEAKIALQLLASESADFDLVVGPNRPENKATVGAPSGTNVGSTSATTIETRANDPATRINQNTVTVDGGKLTAGSVAAAQIAGYSITANKLMIGDTTNYAENSDFALGNVGWIMQRNSGVAPIITASSEAYQGGWIGAVTGQGTGGFRNNAQMRCSLGDQLMGVMIAKGGNAAMYPRICWLNGAGTEIAVTQGGSIAANGSYQRILVYGSVPAGAVFARIEVFYDVQAGGFAYCGYTALMRRATGELIVDGAITTSKMIANTIDGDRIKGGTIMGDKLIANSIAANQLMVASRQISTIGLNIRINPDGNLQWDAGQVRVVNNDGQMGYYDLPGNTVGYQGQHMYFWYQPGRPVIDYNTDSANLGNNGFIMLAVWKGGADLLAYAGVGTLISGDRIVTGSIDANRIKANTILSNYILVGNTNQTLNLGDIHNIALDPAARINGIGTTIDGGKITTGSIKTLQLAANSIGTNQLVAATRPTFVIGINLRVDLDGWCRWDAGAVYTTDNNGGVVRYEVSAGANNTDGWVLYVQGRTYLDFTGDPQWVANNDHIKIAYRSGKNISPYAGVGTLVNGDTIVTGSLNANKITTDTFIGNMIKAGTIQTAQLAAGAITTSKLAIGNSDSIIPDGDFRDPEWWPATATGGALFDTSAPWKQFRRAMRIPPSSFRGMFTPFFTAEPGAVYRIRVSTYIPNNFSGFFNPTLHLPGVAWFSLKSFATHQGNDPTVSGNGSWTAGNYDGSAVYTADYTLTNTTSEVGRQMQFRFDGTFTGDPLEMAVSIIRVSDTTLIANGAITTDKMVANTINADRIAGGTITGDKFNTGTSLPGSITVGTTGVSIETVRKTAANANSLTLERGASTAVTVSGTTVEINTNVGGGWPAGVYAATRESYANGCVLSARLDTVSTFFGLVVPGNRNETGTATNYQTLNACWHNSNSDNRYMIGWNNWTSTVGYGTSRGWTAQTVFSIVYDGRYMIWRADGAEVYRVAWAADQTFFAKICLTDMGRVSNVTFGPGNDNSLNGTDPAARINANSTNITPGRIQIQGGTTLNDWRNGNDSTEIRGGAIAANTIQANRLTVGNRGIKIIGCDFSYNRQDGALYWSDGYVLWTGDNGAPVSSYIAPGGLAWQGGSFNYVFWNKGGGGFYGGRDNWEIAQTNGSDTVLMVTWRNGPNFVANFGGTIVDGDRITTNSIQANRLNVGSLSAISANIGTVTAGTIRSSDSKTTFDVAAGRITFNNGSFMKVSGNGFGSSNQFLEWYGPSKSTLEQCTEALAIQYLRTDGQAFFGGKVAEGQLRTTKTTGELGLSQVANGPLVTNGRTRTWTAALNVRRSGTRVSNYAPPSGGWSATFIIEQLVGSSWVQRGDVGNLVGYSYESGNNGYASSSEPANFTQTASGSLVFNDNTGGTEPFQVRARITSLSTPGPSGSSGSTGDSYTQILSINTYEV